MRTLQENWLHLQLTSLKFLYASCSANVHMHLVLVHNSSQACVMLLHGFTRMNSDFKSSRSVQGRLSSHSGSSSVMHLEWSATISTILMAWRRSVKLQYQSCLHNLLDLSPCLPIGGNQESARRFIFFRDRISSLRKRQAKNEKAKILVFSSRLKVFENCSK